MRRTYRGFTLIEVLVVIAVFSIGVLAVLKMITSNIQTTDTLRLKTTAAFLAKESMTLAFNIRDTNRLAGLERDCVPNTRYDENNVTKLDVCNEYLISGQQTNTAWMLGFATGSFVDIRKVSLSSDFDRVFTQTRLNLSSGTTLFPVMSYGTGNAGIPTYFARYLVFTGLIDQGKIIDKNQLVKVESHVLYQKGSNTGEVVLESFIGNY